MLRQPPEAALELVAAIALFWFIVALVRVFNQHDPRCRLIRVAYLHGLGQW